MSRERDGGGGAFPAAVAFPVVADFAAFHEFRHIGGDHRVAAVRAAHRRGEGAHTGELWPVAMELHGRGLLWIVSHPGG